MKTVRLKTEAADTMSKIIKHINGFVDNLQSVQLETAGFSQALTKHDRALAKEFNKLDDNLHDAVVDYEMFVDKLRKLV